MTVAAWVRYMTASVMSLTVGGRPMGYKLSITPQILFSLQSAALRRDSHPTTSQPSPADFRGRFEFLLRHYKSVLALSLSSGISGTFD